MFKMREKPEINPGLTMIQSQDLCDNAGCRAITPTGQVVSS